MSDPTDPSPVAASHHTGGRRPRRAATEPRHGQPRESNFRLWVLVAAVVLVLPLAVLGVRALSGGDVPDQAVPVPATSPSGTAPAGSPGSAATPGPSAEVESAPEATDPEPAEPSSLETSETSSLETSETTDPETSEGNVPDEEPGGTAPDVEPEAAGPEDLGADDVPTTGSGDFTLSELTREPEGSEGRLVRYRIQVEADLPLDVDDTAERIADVLADERSWTGDGSVRFELVGAVGAGEADFTVSVTSPDTTDEMCSPLQTDGKVSCRTGDDVVLNALRWVDEAEAYDGDLTGYHRYLVNHEVGHWLGYDHVPCPGEGEPAPIMLQQTRGVDGCKPHPWVKPSDR